MRAAVTQLLGGRQARTRKDELLARQDVEPAEATTASPGSVRHRPKLALLLVLIHALTEDEDAQLLGTCGSLAALGRVGETLQVVLVVLVTAVPKAALLFLQLLVTRALGGGTSAGDGVELLGLRDEGVTSHGDSSRVEVTVILL